MNAASCAQARPRFLDPAEKTRVGLEAILEPIVFGSEADQHASRFAVPRNDDFLFPGFTQEARQVVLDLG